MRIGRYAYLYHFVTHLWLYRPIVGVIPFRIVDDRGIS